jgi:hypothetical protein
MGFWPRSPEAPTARLVRTALLYAETAPIDLSTDRSPRRSRQVGRAATGFIAALEVIDPEHPVVVRNREEGEYFEGAVLDAAAVVIATEEFAELPVIANPANGEGFGPPLEAA